MWTTLRQEIEKIRIEFNIQDRLRPIGLNEWKDIEDKLYGTFSIITSPTSRPAWIWEKLKVQSCRIITDEKPYQLLNQLIDGNIELFLFLNESVNQHDKLWIYEGTIEPIQKLIAESTGIDEVIIIDKKYTWILCINHHKSIIIGGQTMIDNLKRLPIEFILD